MNTIDRLDWSQADSSGFPLDFMSRDKPYIITNAFNHWPACRKWTPEFFRAVHGERQVRVDKRNWLLKDLIPAIEKSTPAQPAPYFRNDLLAKWPAEVQADIEPVPLCTQRNWLEARPLNWIRYWRSFELYIGGAGAKFPELHYDVLHLHAFLMQLYGEKEYLVYPPDQLKYMYRGEGVQENKSMVADPDHPDLAKFPEFAKAQGARFRLLPGETLFVPCGWWHTAKILTTSITVSINAISRSNWSEFRQDLVVESFRESRSVGYKAAVRAKLSDMRMARQRAWT